MWREGEERRKGDDRGEEKTQERSVPREQEENKQELECQERPLRSVTSSGGGVFVTLYEALHLPPSPLLAFHLRT